MTFRKSASRKTPRWVALIIVVALALGLVATTALASHVDAGDAPIFNFRPDDDGADDEPGQKDLNSHAAATDEDGFWVTFEWDVTGLKGNNTADGCSLFDTDATPNKLVDAAICVTAEKSPLTLKSVVIYTCGDTRDDRCANPTKVPGPYLTECFIVNNTPDSFHGDSSDTQSICLVVLAEIQIGTTTPTLINTCSYPSQEPNSDPSDCVVRISLSTNLTTASSGTTTWTATLEDVATLSPTTATGTVTFRLYNTATCGAGGVQPVWTSSAVPVAQGTASTVDSVAASEIGSNTISSATANVATVYYWTATYTPTPGSDFLPNTPVCGEVTTITPASVQGFPAP